MTGKNGQTTKISFQGNLLSVHSIFLVSFSVPDSLPGSRQFLIDLEGGNSPDLDKNYVSELRKISSFTYKKLINHDRIRLTTNCRILHILIPQ